MKILAKWNEEKVLIVHTYNNHNHIPCATVIFENGKVDELALADLTCVDNEYMGAFESIKLKGLPCQHS